MSQAAFDLTLAIVTKNRPKELIKCLKSIAEQTTKPGVVLVVDNDQEMTAKTVCGQSRKKLNLPIEYVVEKRPGIPVVRNIAISLCKTSYLGYVDDDCVLDKNWVRQGLQKIKSSRASYVIGISRLANKESLIAQAQYFHYKKWFEYKLDRKTMRIDPLNLDTKNVIFDFRILKKHKLKFDEIYNKAFSGEDVDLGLQLSKLGYGGFLAEKMQLKHKEVENLLKLWSKAYYRGISSYLLIKKWQLKDQLVDLTKTSWYRFLKTIWVKPYDYQKLSKGVSFKRKIIHLLTKVYDRAWLEGYLKQSRQSN